MKPFFLHVLLLAVCLGTFALTGYVGDTPKNTAPVGERLRLVQDQKAQTISVLRSTGKTPILIQNAKADFRPFIHPIVAPDGKGVLTEYSPGHHKHQTGLYWGYTRVNGRDYFHHPQGDYWRRKSAKILRVSGPVVKWETVYDLLDSTGTAVLTETQVGRCGRWRGNSGSNWSGGAKPKRISRLANMTTAGCFCGCPGAKASTAK